MEIWIRKFDKNFLVGENVIRMAKPNVENLASKTDATYILGYIY